MVSLFLMVDLHCTRMLYNGGAEIFGAEIFLSDFREMRNDRCGKKPCYRIKSISAKREFKHKLNLLNMNL
uniref:Uncharacterized protein n=1 Tax=Romanomermis culicivorax TaxID=13658 RepID=A0A915L976_ROMCU